MFRYSPAPTARAIGAAARAGGLFAEFETQALFGDGLLDAARGDYAVALAELERVENDQAPDAVKLFGNLQSKDAKILGQGNFIVARDQDLLDSRVEILPVTYIRGTSIIAVPWGKFWALGDHPGRQSDLAQPSVIFTE